MTARPIRYQRQVSDRKGKIFYTSIASLSHISKICTGITIITIEVHNFYAIGFTILFCDSDLRFNRNACAIIQIILR